MRVSSSEECSKSELDLFTVPPTQVAIEEGVWDDIKPHPFFQEGTVTFDVPGDSSHYLCLAETELWLKVRLQKKTPGSAPVDAVFDGATKANVAPVNNLLHSLFSQVQIFLNGKEVENTNSNYAYKAYLANLLCFGKESKETFLENEMFIKDQAGRLGNSLFTYKVGNEEIVPEQNSGLLLRYNKFKNNQPVQLKGRLHCDIFNVNKYMLTNVNIQVKLTRNKPEFYLIGQTKDHLITIEECFLRVRRAKIAPSVMLDHAMMLEKTTAKYPIKRVVVKQFTLPYNASKASINGIHTGIMPTRVVCGFLKNTDYDGTLDSNPFNFRNYGIKHLTLKISSKAIPYSSGLEMDYAKDCYMQAYNSLFQNIREVGNDISYKDYKQGYTIYAFDLSPDLCSSEHFNIFKDGSLDMDIDFESAQDSAITTVFYLEFDNMIEITKQRNIVFDYQV